MYAGHLAIGLAIKARVPDVPSLPIFLGVAFLDILHGLFVLTGLAHVTANSAAGPYLFFDLSFVDWDHSLLMAIIWSLLWGVLFIKDKRIAGIAVLAAFSHFLSDWPMHNGDLALYPHADMHLGLGLWGQLGTGAWWLEGLFVLALCTYAWFAYAQRGISLLWPCVLILLMFLNLSPWLSPLKLVATLQEPLAHQVLAALILSGFLLPALLLSWLVERAQQPNSSRTAYRRIFQND